MLYSQTEQICVDLPRRGPLATNNNSDLEHVTWTCLYFNLWWEQIALGLLVCSRLWGCVLNSVTLKKMVSGMGLGWKKRWGDSRVFWVSKEILEFDMMGS